MINIQFVKFLFFGGFNTLFVYSIFALLIYIGIHYSLAVLIATVLGVIFNFNTIGRIVFKKLSRYIFLKFIFVYFIMYIFNIIGIHCFKLFEVSEYIAGAVLIFPISVATYLILKNYVYN